MSQPTLGSPISTSATGGVASVTASNVVIAAGESLFVAAGGGQDGSFSLTGATRNALALASAWPSVNDTNFCASRGFYQQSPSVGTFDCVVTFSVTTNQAAITAIPLAGAIGATGGITNSQTSAGGTTPSVGTLSPTADDIVLAHIMTDSGNVGSVSVTGSGVQVDERENIANDTTHSVQKITSGGTVTASWGTAADSAAMGAVIIQGVAGPVPGVVSSGIRRGTGRKRRAFPML